jgi:hypothetical protein
VWIIVCENGQELNENLAVVEFASIDGARNNVSNQQHDDFATLLDTRCIGFSKIILPSPNKNT